MEYIEKDLIKSIIAELRNEEKEQSNFYIKDMWKEYMQWSMLNKEESTCVNDETIYSIHIAPFFVEDKLFDITPKRIMSWHLTMNEYLSYQTVINNHKTFSKLFSWIDRVYSTNWNPVSKVGIPKRTVKKKEMTIWSEYEFFQFYSQIPNLEHKTIFLLFFFGGFRRGELLALKWNDLINNHLRVDESIANIKGKQVLKNPKNFNSFRLVEIDTFTVALLNELHDIKKSKVNYHQNNYIFGRQTRPMAFETLRKTKVKYEDLARLPHIRIHDLRHSHVSLLINNHMPVIAIAQRIGDSIEEVLTTYAHLLPQSSLEISIFLNKTTGKYQNVAPHL